MNTNEASIAILCKHLSEKEACEHCGLSPHWTPISEVLRQNYSWTHRLAREAKDVYTLLVVGTDWDRVFPGDLLELSETWKLKPLALVIENPSEKYKAGRMWTMEPNSQPEQVW